VTATTATTAAPAVRAWTDPSGEAALLCQTTAWNGLGFSPHQIWAFRRAEIAAHAETPFHLSEGQRATMLHIRTLPQRSKGVERMTPVLHRLLAPLFARLATLGRPRVAVVLALAERFAECGRCHGSVRALSAAVASEAESAGIEISLQVEARGHSGLAFALPAIGSALAAGRLDAAIVGGVDTYYEADPIDELLAGRRLFDGKNLEGFLPGEGGAFLLFTRGDVARSARWPAAARLEAVASAEEPAALDLELPVTAAALTGALRAICDPVAAAGRTVDQWFCDLTHEPDRVREWMLWFARATAGASAPDAAVELLPPFLGDLGAATLPTALVLAAEGFARGDPPGRTCVACASSTGPGRGAVLLSKRP
jgi:3-oxoacyl-[acyl-carrier-protein] synthase-1